jgi:branched-chain amino acid transport system ATP-binding protein
VPISGGEPGHPPLLQVQGLEAGYGKIRVLHGVDLVVREGEVVTLLGPNGAGKSTLLRALSGLLPVQAGTVRLGDTLLSGAGPRKAVRAGMSHVIEGHRVFTGQTVRENLLLAAYDLPRAEREARIEEALAHFPEIAAKSHDKGASLSGGQQQMLAVAQGLVQRPRLLMLDEPSAGLRARAGADRARGRGRRARPPRAAGAGVFRRGRAGPRLRASGRGPVVLSEPV